MKIFTVQQYNKKENKELIIKIYEGRVDIEATAIDADQSRYNVECNLRGGIHVTNMKNQLKFIDISHD